MIRIIETRKLFSNKCIGKTLDRLLRRYPFREMTGQYTILSQSESDAEIITALFIAVERGKGVHFTNNKTNWYDCIGCGYLWYNEDSGNTNIVKIEG